MYQLFHDNYSSEELSKSVEEILKKTKLCSMATISEDCGEFEAWINAQYYSYDDQLRIYFLSPSSTLHAKNLSKNHSAAISVFDSHQDPEGKKQGLQFLGLCGRVGQDKKETAFRSWWERMVNDSDFEKFCKEYEEDDSSKMYFFHPIRVKISDETQFGDETCIDAGVRSKD